jgi:hypothetical protein
MRISAILVFSIFEAFEYATRSSSLGTSFVILALYWYQYKQNLYEKSIKIHYNQLLYISYIGFFLFVVLAVASACCCCRVVLFGVLVDALWNGLVLFGVLVDANSRRQQTAIHRYDYFSVLLLVVLCAVDC